MMPRFANTADADLITEICSHPEVRRWTAQDSTPGFEVTRWLHPTNMVVLVDDGCFLSNWLGDQTFGVHTNILPEGRGKSALLNGGLALMLAFLRSNAETFMTMVPSNNRAASWFTKAMGFRWMFRQEGKWVQGGKAWDLDHYRLDVDDWILQGHLGQVGKAFHREVEGLGLLSHDEDEVHDAYVGALVAMAEAGKLDKGLKIYNRWARAAGYVPVVLVSRDPLTLDCRDFLVRMVGGSLQFELKETKHA